MNLEQAFKNAGQEKPMTCETHGAYTAINLFNNNYSRCPECTKEETEKKRLQDEEIKRQHELNHIQKLISRSLIPLRFSDRTLDNYQATTEKQKQALEFSRQYVSNIEEVVKNGRSAIFCGKAGTGKTHLACGIANEIMQSHYSALFLTVIKAIRMVKDTWSKDSEENENDVYEKLVKPSLLILDEIGVQFGSEAEKIILFEIINERYEARQPTILISNLSLTDVKQYLGDRIFDRMREDGGKYISFDWDSYRGNIK
jgi:DNA replication protein DnaC